ncbi:ABC transporter ATP-binding protein [Desulfatitalea alkaliphila]|uniref:ATP-binding cassette domain-containing protein n=1 Tax=Desulfatitalea alkaliphila TaxID=2929485 RepID=A0AA41UJA8_9BACT|nr:ATP-binding cassette domain-containing protein [Desulfatitalea alkaliphila]MCJ8499186.1 ATP-binding cassette domain-containing protein [Desulfatitalea alkaliphila]
MIQLEQVSKTFRGSRQPAVDRITLRVKQGDICVLVGPSGCGKTTLLRMINRLVEPDDGMITVDGRSIAQMDPPTLRRTIGYVIQQVGLLPHRTIAQNIALVPELLKWPREKTARRVAALLEMMDLDPGEVGHKYPHQLSGGQAQRVGVARALAADPPIMLMDEPFAAVDPIVRVRLQDQLLRLQQTMQKTICFVTHDINEAIKLGDHLVVLKAGRMVQSGTPLDILTQPENDFVLRLLGDDRGVKILDQTRAETLMDPFADAAAQAAANGHRVQAIDPVKIALERMMLMNTDEITVCEGARPVGLLRWNAIKAHVHRISGGAS